MGQSGSRLNDQFLAHSTGVPDIMLRLTHFTKASFILSLMTLLTYAPVSGAADPANGEQLYQKCITCHGKNGQGKKSQNAPRLAGQFDWYIVTALKDFQSGARKNPPMKPFIENLSESDFEDLAAYISSMEFPMDESQETQD